MATAQFRKGDRVQHKRSKKVGAVVRAELAAYPDGRKVLVEWNDGRRLRSYIEASCLRKCEDADRLLALLPNPEA